MRSSAVFHIGVVGLLTLASVSAYGQADTSVSDQAAAVVDTNGNLRVPANYRTSYQFLGSWAVAESSGKSPTQLHVVYASPGTIAAYRKNKRFRDGSVLVKEVFQATTESMKTGVVSRAQVLKGWFVMVKERKDTHPDNPLWGEGWAWSWFDADNSSKTTSTNFRVNCLSCHVPAQSTDWIYVQGYPALERAH
jgi:Cytochrome P460